MQIEPRVLGAVAAAVVLGVSSGAVLGKVPEMRHDDYLARLAENRPSAPMPFEQEQAKQDQYALITDEGRFEVSQLSDRGLYRNVRYSPAFAVGAWDDYLDAAAHYDTGAQPSSHAESGVIEVAADGAAMPVEALPQMAVNEVTPRIINVTAELAARNQTY
jgi:hypothetical protein